MSNHQTAPVVACISLEPWDAVWRRNQHLASTRPRRVVGSSRFVAAALKLLGTTTLKGDVVGWDERAEPFADVLLSV